MVDINGLIPSHSGWFLARGGDDILRGGLGNDGIRGGSGADKLFGEKGADALDAKDGVRRNDAMNVSGCGINMRACE
jgi:Ca2+-binding RTX toxin-like protein